MKRSKQPGKIYDAKAPGGFVLVEMLTSEEVLATRLELPNAKGVPPQAYILDIGPAVDSLYGLAQGQRVLLQGSFVPVPRFKEGRDLGVVSPSDIKCILLED